MPKKKPMSGKPEVHPDLDGFEMGINEFGEITTNMNIDKLNKFLNENVDDKKFRELDDIPYALGKTKEEDDEIAEDDDELDEFDLDDDEDDDDSDIVDDEPLAAKEEKDPYDFDDGKHEYEEIEDLVKNMQNDFGKRGKAIEDDDDKEIIEEEFLDEYADDFSEEDKYNLDEDDLDER